MFTVIVIVIVDATYSLKTHGKNIFAEGFKTLLDTNLKIILLDQNTFVGTFKNNQRCCKKL